MNSGAALFGRRTIAPVPRNLCQIKAGKMNMKEDNWVHSESRKGLAYMYQTHDGQLHFCWIDRQTGFVEENFVIEPKQAKFKRVTQCPNNRVYCLTSKSNKRLFLWMQERYPSFDLEFCKKVNQYINDPPSAMEYFRNNAGMVSLAHSDLMAFLSNSSLAADSDISSIRATPSTVTRRLNTLGEDNVAVQGASTVGGDKSKPLKIELNDLRNIVNSIKLPTQGASNFARSKIDLNDALNVKELDVLIKKPEVYGRLKEHLPELPAGTSVSDKPVDELKENIKSSQFKQTLKSFSAALSMKELTPLITQFNLGEKVNEAAKAGDMMEFAKALQESLGSSSAADESSEKEKPEKMDES